MLNKYICSLFLLVLLGSQIIAQSNPKVSGQEARSFFVKSLIEICDPVLTNLAKDKLKATMPIEVADEPYDFREEVAHLEVVGRTLAGMAPWLELGPDNSKEGQLRKKYIDLAVKGIANAVNPEANDYLNFTEHVQPLVDAAFLAEALIRAPKQLWGNLDKITQQRVLKELKSTRSISPLYMNWLLFSGMIEAALLKFDDSADMVRIEYCLIKHDEWYLGDGIYGDGPDFHWDYYNSFVIQPMILDILSVLKEKEPQLEGYNYKDKFITDNKVFLERAQRYAEIQERLIAPDGTYPIIGRSMAYRFGVFQSLSQIALFEVLPQQIKPAQVREALYAVIKNQLSAPETFNTDGWLNIGFYGHQRSIAEPYITTGSLYLCTTAFLVLGLPENNPFWSDAPENWTQKKVWSGQDIPIDHAYYLKKEEK
ncbi:DUF2264 domain-containing protein [Muricauda sp. CAU 1633]|uniref:DUF2264 domain-containing protein n=1 Tax=Allomuricauda sp. CAU 1633 TaxID=2816036 RepID=UPI001A90A48A|nr:DUF2264 domain-containing protein [Muricauda sp. CAU 1633]MBO0321007.1 DUF2264 domain-containing protein [Muricauda sp. CAU 1633]